MIENKKYFQFSIPIVNQLTNDFIEKVSQYVIEKKKYLQSLKEKLPFNDYIRETTFRISYDFYHQIFLLNKGFIYERDIYIDLDLTDFNIDDKKILYAKLKEVIQHQIIDKYIKIEKYLYNVILENEYVQEDFSPLSLDFFNKLLKQEKHELYLFLSVHTRNYKYLLNEEEFIAFYMQYKIPYTIETSTIKDYDFLILSRLIDQQNFNLSTSKEPDTVQNLFENYNNALLTDDFNQFNANILINEQDFLVLSSVHYFIDNMHFYMKRKNYNKIMTLFTKSSETFSKKAVYDFYNKINVI